MFKKKILENGVRIVYEKIPYLRSVSIGIWVGTGSRYENELNNGISHLIEHMMFKGTDKLSARQIAQSMESIGGHLNAFTGRECTCYYAKVLDEHIQTAIDILSDIFFKSRMLEKDLETEKKVILEEISMYEDTPDDLAHDILAKSVWKGSPLGLPILGNKRCLENISRINIEKFMSENYVPERTVVSVAGSFDETQLLDELDKKFGCWKADAGHEQKNTVPACYIRSFKVKEKNIEQVHMCMGMDGIEHRDERLYSLMAVNNILGGTVSSRLFQKVREDMGLVYSIYSYPSSYTDNGLFTIYAGMNPHNIKDVISIIIDELSSIINKGIDEEELHRAKEQLKGSFILGLESTGSRMNSIGKSELLLGFIRTPDQILEKIDSISMDTAVEAIESVFGAQKISVAVVGKLMENTEDLKNLI